MEDQHSVDQLADTLYYIIPLIRKNLVHLSGGKFEGYTLLHIVLLQNVALYPGISLGELAQQINISKQQLTPLLDMFEQRQILCRSQSSSDRRRVELHLLPEGRKLLEHNRQQFAQGIREKLESIPQEETRTYQKAAETFLKLLRTL